MSVVLWTSTADDGLQKEFCSILNEVLRDDVHGLMPQAATLTRAITSIVVKARGGKNPNHVWPKDFGYVSYRGTVMPREEVDRFFLEGLQYRVPMFLATSFKEDVPIDFMQRGMQNAPAGHTPVLFKFCLDQKNGCDHALYIEKISLCQNEHELLFVPYSSFQVLKITIPPVPDAENPKVIELMVFPNNKTVREDVVCSKWH